ncbi:sulfurtransferase [Macrococcus sp. DPC7161]|uniref:sulfurtransferase n=1 Tax=Macrococcus sp. DPC7161 TaxID=2507060 RepID=UPI00100BEA50|nr:rhodanese-like domain-containing protein [Macrococcus sp. DPC7161]RXK19247.1 hypothetical protein ER639_02710 [Macrococcus sp. DPC7161]
MKIWIGEEEAFESIKNQQAILFDVRSVMDNKEATLNGFKEIIQDSVPILDYKYLYGTIHSNHTNPVVSGRHPLPDLNQLYAKLIHHTMNSHGETKDIIIIDHQNGFNASRLVFLCKLLNLNSQIIDGGYENITLFNKVPYELDDKETFKIKDLDDKNKNFNQKYIAFFDEIKSIIENKKDNKILIDARAYQRYIGEIEPIDSIKGHIPTAINIPYNTLFINGYIKDKTSLRNIFKNVLTKECIVYCGSGMSATPLFCALLSLDEKVKVYAGSYSEWIEKNNNVEVGDFNE